MTDYTTLPMQLNVRATIARVIQNHTNEAEEEAGFIADDIMSALSLPQEIPVPVAARGQHAWPCPLFYVGNWNEDRPRARCSCSSGEPPH